MYNTEYIIAVEHLILQNNHTVDASISYIPALCPNSESDAVKFFSKTRNKEYTNIHGVTNKITVVAVYKRIDRG